MTKKKRANYLSDDDDQGDEYGEEDGEVVVANVQIGDESIEWSVEAKRGRQAEVEEDSLTGDQPTDEANLDEVADASESSDWQQT